MKLRVIVAPLFLVRHFMVRKILTPFLYEVYREFTANGSAGGRSVLCCHQSELVTALRVGQLSSVGPKKAIKNRGFEHISKYMIFAYAFVAPGIMMQSYPPVVPAFAPFVP